MKPSARICDSFSLSVVRFANGKSQKYRRNLPVPSRDRSNLLLHTILYEPSLFEEQLIKAIQKECAMLKPRRICFVCVLLLLWAAPLAAQSARSTQLCLDGFCIGQSINDAHFDAVKWLLPKGGLTKRACNGIGCKPEIAFRGYSSEDQKQLTEALSWDYGLMRYNPITNANLASLRRYKYECNLSARGIDGERRFLGAYRSSPSQYLTVVGLRLIGGELRVYRIARQYAYHNQAELLSLGNKLHGQYGKQILFYDYLSSNAYSDVIAQQKNGWFGRSTMFNPSDLSDLAAELVLIDPNTRSLLEPSSMPESGEIKTLPIRMPAQCSAAIPVN